MANWFYFPRCRFDSQGVPQSPFQQSTPVGTADRGVAWNQSLFAPTTPVPNNTIAVGLSQGYVIDDTDGTIIDEFANIFPNEPWPGGTIVNVTFGQPQTFTGGVYYNHYFMRRRSDSATFTLVFTDAGGQHNGVGYPTFTLNPLTSLPWVAAEVMGSATLYDFYTTIDGNVSSILDFIQFDGILNIEYAPAAGTVTSVNPSSGSILGGQAVTITGTGFTAATGVEFGGTAATSVVIVDDTHITAVTPPHLTGLVDVEVLSVATGTGLYTYVVDTIRLPPMPTRTPMTQGGGKSGGARRG